jgi:hypothetical protein
MKNLVLLAFILAAGLSASGETTNSTENFSPHFSTNTKILWQAPTNQLPENIWIYRRLPPQPFLASVISNAVVLASLQEREFPKPSTNTFYISSTPNPCGMGFVIFSIEPATTTISFTSTNQTLATNNLPDDEAVTRRAFECAARFGLDRAHLIAKPVYTSSTAPGCDQNLMGGICGRGILLSRKLDGFGFFSDANSASEGFAVEFGSGGQVRSFSLIWPNLETNRLEKTASQQQIIAGIRAHKIIVLPNPGEETYFQRLKTLAVAKTFTITKITPCYGEGVFGKVPTNDEPPEFIAPFAEVEAVADFGNSNAPVRFASPIVSSEFAEFDLK